MLPSQLPYISSASGYSYHVLTAVSLSSLLPYLCVPCSRFRVLGRSVFLAKLVQLELKSCFLRSSLPLSVWLEPPTEAPPRVLLDLFSEILTLHTLWVISSYTSENRNPSTLYFFVSQNLLESLFCICGSKLFQHIYYHLSKS